MQTLHFDHEDAYAAQLDEHARTLDLLDGAIPSGFVDVDDDGKDAR